MKTLNIGVTGTRNGMNTSQQSFVREYLSLSNIGSLIIPPNSTFELELHHGDCIGVDVEVANIAQELGYKTVNYPPIETSLRAYHKSDIILEPKTYFARNRDIVDNSEILLVVPMENSHQTKGGTWYTHDYAKKKNKTIFVFYPNGNIEVSNIGEVL
jgi:hypothetical protein